MGEQKSVAEPVSFDPVDSVRHKQWMYRRLEAGAFGNIARLWNSVEDVLASGYRGAVSLRSKETSNPVRKYHVPVEDLAEVVAGLPEQWRRAPLVFSESPPDHKRTIQGELCRNPELYFEYTFVQKPMRLAFEEQRLVSRGLSAKLLLQRYLLPVDIDDLLELLDRYPDDVIEFSSFDCYVGTIPLRKTLIWEVRSY